MRLTIIGAGISGLSLAYFLNKQRPDVEILILEADNRAGGKILTDHQKGYLCEAAVNGFLDNKPLTLSFISELGLTPLRSNDAARKRFIYVDGRLHLLPESPQSFLLSGLLSPCGKARLLAELMVPKTDSEDESLAAFARRRLGKEAYEKLIEPMAIGIYAGDAENLSLRSCFPRIYQLQKEYGSLFKALLKLQRKAKKGTRVGPAPSGVLTSFRKGMETVVSRLYEILKDRIHLSKKVEAVERCGNHYRVYVSDSETVETDAVVFACPAYETSRIIKTLSVELSLILSEIPYPPVSVVCIGYRQEDIEHSLKGFGFLIPSREQRKILGCLWDSSIFPDRAPDGYVLLRVMLGGAKTPELALQEDERMLSVVLEELKDIMGIDVTPEFVRIYRHEKAIPQYTLGHYRRLERIEETIRGKDLKGFFLSGNAYRGVGFNDCIQVSYDLAREIVQL